jgi:anti-sigma factor RsiW
MKTAMNIDESTLRAYVDAELPSDQRQQVEAALLGRPELGEQVAALRASCLPYRAAFDMQKLPPVPPALQRQLADWCAVADTDTARPATLSRRHWLGTGAALAASFAAGLLLPTPWRLQTTTTTTTTTADTTPWVEAIAKYQALYVRATVEQAQDDAVRARSVLADFNQGAKLRVAVPDLRDAGLAFKRIQRLGYGDLPLLQMVFLPERGNPAALCVLPSKQADAPLQVRRLEGMSVATWQRAGLAHVFAADMSLAQATVIAEKLFTDQFPALHAAKA